MSASTSTTTARPRPVNGPGVPDRVLALAPFVDAGVLAEADVHLAATVARLAPDSADEVLLAVALTLAAVGRGHTCVELTGADLLAVDAAATTGVDSGDLSTPGLPWPDQSRMPTCWHDPCFDLHPTRSESAGWMPTT